ncbi:unnamed protein product [Auanema sp. JU1783]|nr:unnamed protein product [Auanema sp. JU1783]
MNVLGPLLLALCLVHTQGFKLAVDVKTSLTTAQIKCLQTNYSIQAVITRVYKPDNTGSFDDNSVGTINLSQKANMPVEIYMEINPNPAIRQGYDQVDELYKQLKKHGFSFRRVWVKVTSDMPWGSDVTVNQGMISQVLGRLRQYGFAVGILTDSFDWGLITNYWTQAGDDVNLWYTNVIAYGASGETAANFNDYKAFGVADTPVMKQYGMFENLCNVPLNR